MGVTSDWPSIRHLRSVTVMCCLRPEPVKDAWFVDANSPSGVQLHMCMPARWQAAHVHVLAYPCEAAGLAVTDPLSYSR